MRGSYRAKDWSPDAAKLDTMGRACSWRWPRPGQLGKHGALPSWVAGTGSVKDG
jgi:hypothetical protein